MDSIKAVIMTVVTFFSALFGITTGDKMTPGDYPIIEPEIQAEDTVRIMSFNVRCTDVGGTPMFKRTSIVVDEIKAVMPDSVGVQEATVKWMKTLKRELSDYEAVGTGRDRNGRGEHSAIFFRKDKYELVNSGTFWLSETPDKVSKDWGSSCNRICTWALLKNKADGTEYVHVNTHLDHISELARQNGSKLITDFIKANFSDKYVVFTADLNSQDTGAAYLEMTSLLNDSRLNAEKADVYGTFHSTHPETRANNFLDYVLYSDNITPKAYKTVTAGIDGRFVSDHFPIYADFTFNKL